MKYIFLNLLFVITPYTALIAQTIQHGLAREINSDNQPVAGVSIEFDEAVPTNSDADGNFRLAFQDKAPGDLIFLNDIRKKGYELVNRKDFEVLKISRHDTLLQDAILAKSGYVDAAKREYYNISSKALYEGFEKEKQKLKDKLNEVKITQEQYINEMNLLQEQFDIQQENIDALADKFARINFDDISKLHRDALTLFKAGEVEACKEKLESANLIPRINLRIQERKRIKEATAELTQQQIANEVGIQEDIQLIQLQTQTHLLSFEYKKAEVLYDRLLLLDSTNLEILREVANFYNEQHLYDKAKQTYPKIIRHPEVEEWRIANAHGHMGELYIHTGNIKAALNAFTLCSEKYQELHSQNPNQSSDKNGLAISYERLGKTYNTMGNLNTALQYFEQSKELLKQLFKDYSHNKTYKNGLAISCQNIGHIHRTLGDLDKALKYFEQYNELEKQLYDSHPHNLVYKNLLAVSYQHLGEIHSNSGNLDNALHYFEKFNELEKQLHESYPYNIEFKHVLAISYHHLGNTHSFMGNVDKALKFYEHQTILFNALYKDYPQNVSFKHGLANSYQCLGEVQTILNDTEKALLYFEQYNKLEKQLHESYPKNVSFKDALAISYQYLGIIHKSLNNFDEALQHMEKFSDLSKQLYKSYPNNISFARNLSISYEKIGSTHYLIGNLGKALHYFKQYHQLVKELYKKNPQHLSFKDGLAVSYMKLGFVYLEQESPKAKPNLVESQRLFLELRQSFPKNARFKQNLELVEATLEDW